MTFVNALASECLGRGYLLQKPDLVEVLVRMLHQEKGDTDLASLIKKYLTNKELTPAMIKVGITM